MTQQKIPCMLMRGGTSKGPFFDLRDLPADEKKRNRMLLRIMGSPDINQIDGLGGAKTVTSKVVMVQPSSRNGVDVDYLFAQVEIDKAVVDTRPTCGNMMTGVAPFAIERGMVDTSQLLTTVRVYNINTDSFIEVIVQTPDGKISYDGESEISGVPGRAALIQMNLFDQHGAKTGSLFPTGKKKEDIDGVNVTLADACTALMLIKAEDLNLTGLEGHDYFAIRSDFMKRLARMRLEAGRRMGFGDVTDSVLPRIGILSKAQKNGTLKSQYFTPHTFHHAHAVSGAICIAAACKVRGTVANDVSNVSEDLSETIHIEHVSGSIPVQLDLAQAKGEWMVKRAGVLRTARKIMDGFVFVPKT